MSTSERARSRRRSRTALVLGLAGACLLAVVTTSCGPSEECLRFSDCDEGLTCSNGRCRSADELANAVVSVEAGEGGPATDASTSDAKITKDASSTADGSDGGADATPSDAPAG